MDRIRMPTPGGKYNARRLLLRKHEALLPLIRGILGTGYGRGDENILLGRTALGLGAVLFVLIPGKA